jgi:mRNA-degrading endonuclease toxin of MazEF toxin-antitoxin module
VANVTERLRWSIVVVDLDQVEGHEQAGRRRALIVSYEPFHASGLVTLCPITASRSAARYPGDVAIAVANAGQTRPGVIICSQVRTISTRRIQGRPLGFVTDIPTRAAVREALAHHLGLDIPALLDGAA